MYKLSSGKSPSFLVLWLVPVNKEIFIIMNPSQEASIQLTIAPHGLL